MIDAVVAGQSKGAVVDFNDLGALVGTQIKGCEDLTGLVVRSVKDSDKLEAGSIRMGKLRCFGQRKERTPQENGFSMYIEDERCVKRKVCHQCITNFERSLSRYATHLIQNQLLSMQVI
nr:hypothetical protein [Microvirga sp.]